MIASVALDPCLLGLGRFSDGVGVASRDLDQVRYRLAEKANWLGANPVPTSTDTNTPVRVGNWLGNWLVIAH